MICPLCDQPLPTGLTPLEEVERIHWHSEGDVHVECCDECEGES